MAEVQKRSSKRKAEALVEQEANHHDRPEKDEQQQLQKQESSSSSLPQHDPSSSSSSYTTRQDLKCLDILEHPVWVFDIENKSMWWANTSAALSLWNSPTRQALLERNFAHDMSEATHKRLQDYLRRFKEGEKVHESVRMLLLWWLFFFLCGYHHNPIVMWPTHSMLLFFCVLFVLPVASVHVCAAFVVCLMRSWYDSIPFFCECSGPFTPTARVQSLFMSRARDF
jgi:hypothetical protein